MNILRLLKGKTPEQIEAAGDNYFNRGEYGSSRLEYEKALSKLEKTTSRTAPEIDRIKGKMVRSCNALATEHLSSAKELMESEYLEDAENLLTLALELATDEEILSSIQTCLALLKNREIPADGNDDRRDEGLFERQESISNDPPYEDPGDHYFTLLVSTLPEEDQSAYNSYNGHFREGYVRLNQGHFEEAAAQLTKALEESGPDRDFIPLELGTACLNLGNNEQALLHLERFVKHHPETLRAYPLLCEVYWQDQEFKKAHILLQHCPESLKNEPVIHILEGETFFQEKKYEEAEAHYASFVHFCGWDEGIARAHAKTLEALGRKEDAKRQYAQILNSCQGCGKKTDPLIKQQYADLSLETGDHSTSLLELYLALIQEIPENRAANYAKISAIFAMNGNESEAGRFQRFSDGTANSETLS